MRLPRLLYPGDPGVPGGLIPTDYHPFAPRLGFAWDPTGSGKWIVRGAYGVFFEPLYNGQGGPLQDIISSPPYFKIIEVGGPSYSDPTAGINALAPGFNYPETFDALDPHMRLPYAQDWNFNVQRSFGNGWIAQLGYVGTKGTKLPRFIEVDPAVYVPGTCGSGPCSTEDNVDQRRIHSGCNLSQTEAQCQYTSEAYLAGVVNSNYNGLQASLRKSMAYGLSLLASYVYSKSIDDNSSFNMTGGSSRRTSPGKNDLAQNSLQSRSRVRALAFRSAPALRLQFRMAASLHAKRLNMGAADAGQLAIERDSDAFHGNSIHGV